MEKEESNTEMVTQPTKLCAAMVQVPKPNKKVLSAHLRKINHAVRWVKYVLPTTEDITTFMTPFGRDSFWKGRLLR